MVLGPGNSVHEGENQAPAEGGNANSKVKGFPWVQAALMALAIGAGNNAYANTNDASMTPVAFDGSTLTAPSIAQLVEKHKLALEAASLELVSNIEKDPDFEGFSKEEITGYAQEILFTFIKGIEDGTLRDFIIFSPKFTNYVLDKGQDFPLSDALAKEVLIAVENAKQGEGYEKIAAADVVIDAENAKQAAEDAKQAEGYEEIAAADAIIKTAKEKQAAAKEKQAAEDAKLENLKKLNEKLKQATQ